MQPPDDQPASADRWVPFAEAQRILGKTETTLRREIKAGLVEAATFPRNPANPADRRSIYRVLIPHDLVADVPTESEHPPQAATEPPARAEWLERKLDERDETVREKDAQIEVLSDRVAALEREAGRAELLAEQLAAERARATAAEAELERLRGRPWWDRLRNR